jgi:hypothetical protein
MYYHSPAIVRSVPINRLALISLFFCGVFLPAMALLRPLQFYFAILFAILAEAIRGGMYAMLWTAYANHVQSSKSANSLFQDDSTTGSKSSHISTIQTILEIVYKGFGHGVLTLSVGLGLFNELFSYASVINSYHKNSSRLLKDKNL